MEWDILSYQSVGPLKFGLNRKEIRKNFEDQPEVKVVTNAKPPLDVYPDKGLYVVYDKYGISGAIEIKKPGKAIFHNQDLLAIPYDEALSWFHSMDNDIEETEEQFVSWKYGILFYAPGKNADPNILPDTITIFREDFFDVKNGIPDPEIINSFHLQVAFVEPIELQQKVYTDLQSGFKDVFSGNKENGFLIWNGIPVSFSYGVDLPDLLEKWVTTIDTINQQDSGELTEEFSCPSFTSTWQITWNEKFINIKSQWEKIVGGYESALNDTRISELLVLKSDFLAEWKMLFKQSYQAFKASNISIHRDEDRLIMKKLKKLVHKLPGFGKFYIENEKIMTTNADGRKKVNFSKMSFLGQAILVLLVASFVVIPAWLLSKERDSIFWFWENLPRILLYISPFLLIILYVIVKILRVRREMKA